MTAEQLEELLGNVTPDWCVYAELEVGLMPSLFAGRIGHEGFGPIEPLQGYDLTLASLAPTSPAVSSLRIGWRRHSLTKGQVTMIGGKRWIHWLMPTARPANDRAG